MALRIIDIKQGTTVDGPGLRDSIYFAGCKHACEGCHNPQSWSFAAGRDWSEADVMAVLEYDDFNVTFSGGDPMYQAEEVALLAQTIKQRMGKTIWCYTGFRFEELLGDERYMPLLEQVDVLVDSPFELDKRDISLRFRGSTNQRIIDVKQSLATGKPIVLEEYM